MESMIEQLPKNLRQKVKYLIQLTKEHKVEKLRELREKSKDIKIDIYHHSHGFDSYYSDIEKKYFTWPELVKNSNDLMESGATLFTGVIEYKPGVHFVSSLTQSNIKSN
jgi:hypothetical protein